MLICFIFFCKLSYDQYNNTMKKNIIFDFDGTLADTSPVIFTALNKVIPLVGMKPLSWEEYCNLRNKSHFQLIKQFYRFLPHLPMIVKTAQSEMNLLMQGVQPFPGIVEMLVQLQKLEKRIGILSSNTPANIDVFIQKYGLDMFEFIHTEKNLFGKAHALEKVLNKYRYDKAETVYVGDETRDIEACRKIDLDIISVSWGFNTRKSLQKLHPEFLIDSVEELIPQVNRLL